MKLNHLTCLILLFWVFFSDLTMWNNRFIFSHIHSRPYSVLTGLYELISIIVDVCTKFGSIHMRTKSSLIFFLLFMDNYRFSLFLFWSFIFVFFICNLTIMITEYHRTLLIRRFINIVLNAHVLEKIKLNVYFFPRMIIVSNFLICILLIKRSSFFAFNYVQCFDILHWSRNCQIV